MILEVYCSCHSYYRKTNHREVRRDVVQSVHTSWQWAPRAHELMLQCGCH